MADIKNIKVGSTTYSLVDSVHKNIIILEDNGSSSSGVWLAKTNRISAYEDGQVFLYKVPIAGASSGTTLNINALGSKNIYRSGNTKLTTHYSVGSDVLLYYSASLNSGSFTLVNDYDTDSDKKTASGNTSSKIYLIGATSQSSSGQTTYSHDTVYVDTDGHLYCSGKKVSHVGHIHEVTTANAAPQNHIHNVTVNGTTGANSGTAIAAATAIGVKSSSSAAPGGHTHDYEKPTGITLTANSSTATGRIPYVQNISSTGASVSSTANVGSEAHTHNYDKTTGIILTSAEDATEGSITYIESISGSKPSLGGIKTFVTSVNEGSGSLTAYDTATGGTEKIPNGTRIPVITELSKSGYTPVGSVKLTAGTAPSMGSATTKYLHFSAGTTPPSSASFSGNAVTSGGASNTITSSNGANTSTTSDTGSAGSGAANQDTGVTTPSFTGTAVTSGSASTSTTSSAGANTSTTSNTGTAGSTTIASYSAGVLTISNVANHYHTYYAPVAHTHTLEHTHSVTAAGTVDSHTHKYIKPAAHTHTYYGPIAHTHTLSHTHSVTAAGTVTLTSGTAPSLTANTTANSGIKYVEAQGSFSAGTTPKTSASFTGTNSTDVVTGGTTYYLNHTHTSAKGGGSGTVSISGGEYTATTKYLSASPTHTIAASGAPSATTTVVTGVSGGTTSATTKYLSAAPTTTTTATLANSGTNFNAATAVEITSTGSVAPSGHTHSYGSSTALTTTGNSGTAVVAVVEVAASTD